MAFLTAKVGSRAIFVQTADEDKDEEEVQYVFWVDLPATGGWPTTGGTPATGVVMPSSHSDASPTSAAMPPPGHRRAGGQVEVAQVGAPHDDLLSSLPRCRLLHDATVPHAAGELCLQASEQRIERIDEERVGLRPKGVAVLAIELADGKRTEPAFRCIVAATSTFRLVVGVQPGAERFEPHACVRDVLVRDRRRRCGRSFCTVAR